MDQAPIKDECEECEEWPAGWNARREQLELILWINVDLLMYWVINEPDVNHLCHLHFFCIRMWSVTLSQTKFRIDMFMLVQDFTLLAKMVCATVTESKMTSLLRCICSSQLQLFARCATLCSCGIWDHVWFDSDLSGLTFKLRIRCNKIFSVYTCSDSCSQIFPFRGNWNDNTPLSWPYRPFFYCILAALHFLHSPFFIDVR